MGEPRPYEVALDKMKQARADLQKLRDSLVDSHGPELQGVKPGSPELRALEEANERYEAAKAHADVLQEAYRAELGTREAFTPDGTSVLQAWGRKQAEKILQAVDGGITGSNSSVIASFLDPNLYADPQQPRRVAALFPQKMVEGSNHVEAYIQTARTNNAAVVAAGSVKPTSTYTYDRNIVPLFTFAHMTEGIDKTLLDDGQFLADLLAGELREGVLQAVESAIITGNGSGTIDGLIQSASDASNAHSMGADTRVIAIRKAMNRLLVDGFRADAVIMNPNDALDLFTETNDIGDFQLGGPINAQAETVWGVPVVQSTHTTENTVIVLQASQAGVLYVRQGSTVEWRDTGLDESDADLFETNQLRGRGEARATWVCYKPNAVQTLTSFA
jgi:HK97 family phage major capsid protein